MDTRVKSKFHCREMFSLVFLMFVIEELKILFYFLVPVLDFAISFRVISSSEAYFNTKMLVEGMHKLGCKLWAVIGEDFSWDSMKVENIPIVKFGSSFGRQVRFAQNKTSLVGVVIHVDCRGDGLTQTQGSS
jgi:hypothetical protein